MKRTLLFCACAFFALTAALASLPYLIEYRVGFMHAWTKNLQTLLEVVALTAGAAACAALALAGLFSRLR
jgi:hypothetical protein